jgi:uncharacterized membrane protein
VEVGGWSVDVGGRNMLSKTRIAFLILASIFYIGSGILHFTNTGLYLKIMPPYVPYHAAMVYISGVAEIAGGVGLLIPVVRRAAAWGLVALLVAVFPANLYMATDHIQVGSAPTPPLLAWGRLPLQAVFIGWVLWCTKPNRQT